MKSYETVINLMKIDEINYKKPLDRNNLIYSDNIVNDLKEIKKCNSLEDFNSLENEYMLQIKLINENLDYYSNKNNISNNLFAYSKEMYDFYMSTEAANVLEKMIYAFKVFVEKMISLAIKLFRLICIKIAEFKAFLQNGLYKKFNKDDLVHTNIRIKAIPINENMAEIDKFLDEIYRKNYIIGRLFAWNEGNVDTDTIEKELYNFTSFYSSSEYGNVLGILRAELKEKRLKGETASGFFEIFNNSKNTVAKIVKSILYDMHTYIGSIGKYGEYNMTVGDYLKCKPKEKPKLLEILGPKYLENVVKMRKTVDTYIKNLEKIIKKHEYEKYYKSDLEINQDKRDKAVRSIHKAISFLYSLNYYLFMELVNIRSTVAKAIKIGCNGSGYKKYLNKLQVKPPTRIIQTDIDNYKIEELGDIEVNKTEKRIEIRGMCKDKETFTQMRNFFENLLYESKPNPVIFGLRQEIMNLMKQLRDMFKITDKCTLQFNRSSWSESTNYIDVRITKEVEEVVLEDDIELYHTSNTKGLKFLAPSHFNRTMNILFEYPKIFVGYGSPLFRSGKFLQKGNQKDKNILTKLYADGPYRLFKIESKSIKQLKQSIKMGDARIVMDYDVTGASNSVSIICFKNLILNVEDITDTYFNQE